MRLALVAVLVACGGPQPVPQPVPVPVPVPAARAACDEPCRAPCTRVEYYHSEPRLRTTMQTYCMLPCGPDLSCPAGMHCAPFERTLPLTDATPPIAGWYESVDREAMCQRDR